ncbi:MAG: hypothetical protein ISS48_00870 [Candidatus Aenigmarchaeota archaeon]|nr:hypothetical protein [Candidatus Aenigmarchaeota archaeon]
MKKKEILVIFLLALLMTGGICAVFMPLLVKREFACGWPLHISWRMKQLDYYDFEFTDGLSFLIDFLFWFLILVGGWWIIKKLKIKKRKI